MKKAWLRIGERWFPRLAGMLPRQLRHIAYGGLIRCDLPLSDKLVFKLAETQSELEDCFRLLHDAYVEAGFMAADPSAMRITVYHALPTTSTLLCKYGERVVGTLSLIRESAMGFPMQRIFDLDGVRRAGGNVAEVSALAIDRRFRSARGHILLPLLKFMYEYATRQFDTRHLVIAVNPRHIGFYEGVLCFNRLDQHPVTHYDFVNGAPAVGAHLDLGKAPAVFRRRYGLLPRSRNLHRYFTETNVPNILFPAKRFYTTTDPVMTPELIDHFFNRLTPVFSRLRTSELLLLHAIYDLAEYKRCLPPVPDGTPRTELRRRAHRRFSVMCPAKFETGVLRLRRKYLLTVFECSPSGFRVRAERALPIGVQGRILIDLGAADRSYMKVTVLRLGSNDTHVALLRVDEPDPAWLKFVAALAQARTHDELEEATRFIGS